MDVGECSHRGSCPDTGTRCKGAGRSARTDAPEPEPESARTNDPEPGPESARTNCTNGPEPESTRTNCTNGPESARTNGPEPGPLELPGQWRPRRARDTAAGPRVLPDGAFAPGSDPQIAHRQHLRAGGSSSLDASPARHVLHRGMGPALRASDDRRGRL